MRGYYNLSISSPIPILDSTPTTTVRTIVIAATTLDHITAQLNHLDATMVGISAVIQYPKREQITIVTKRRY